MRTKYCPKLCTNFCTSRGPARPNQARHEGPSTLSSVPSFAPWRRDLSRRASDQSRADRPASQGRTYTGIRVRSCPCPFAWSVSVAVVPAVVRLRIAEAQAKALPTLAPSTDPTLRKVAPQGPNPRAPLPPKGTGRGGCDLILQTQALTRTPPQGGAKRSNAKHPSCRVLACARLSSAEPSVQNIQQPNLPIWGQDAR